MAISETHREIRARDAQVEEGDRVTVSYLAATGDVIRITGDVVVVGADRFTITIPKRHGHDERYTIHTPNVDADVATTKVYGHDSGAELDHPTDMDLPAPAGYDSLFHTVEHVDVLKYAGRMAKIAHTPDAEPKRT